MQGILTATEDSASLNIEKEIIVREKKGVLLHHYETANSLLIDDAFAERFKQDDYVIVASRHKSESGFPCLTAHFPGNPGEVSKQEMGGKSRTLGIGYGSLLLAYMKNLHEVREESGETIDVVIEQTHHGPAVKKPLMFVEIGSTEKEWANQKYAEIVADAVIRTVKGFQKMSDSFIAVGNTHYPKKFTDMIIEQGYCFSHVFSKHSAELLDKELLAQACQCSVEKVKGVVIDWKSLKGSTRERVIAAAKELGLEVVRV